MLNRSYEHTAVVFAQVTRAAHLRIPIERRSKARQRRELPPEHFIPLWKLLPTAIMLALMFGGLCIVFSPWFIGHLYGS